MKVKRMRMCVRLALIANLLLPIAVGWRMGAPS